MSPTEADGVACVDVSDPKTGANFRLYDFEYQLAAPAQRTARSAGDRLGVADLRRRSDRRRNQGVRRATGGAGLPRAGSLAPTPAAPVAPPIPKTVETPLAKTVETPMAKAVETPVAKTVETPIVKTVEPADDSAADEWMSPQAAKTAQFVPDPAMLDNAPEPTPVAPLDLAGLAAGSTGAPEAITAEITAQAIAELPSDALVSEPVAAPPVAVTPPAAAAAKADPARGRGQARRREGELGDGPRWSAAVVGLAGRRRGAAARAEERGRAAVPPGEGGRAAGRPLRAPPAARARGRGDVRVRRGGQARQGAGRALGASDRDRGARARSPRRPASATGSGATSKRRPRRRRCACG